MTDTLQASSQLPHDANNRPLRRPGWGLIQDVRPRQTRHTAAAIQPEAQPVVVTPIVSHSVRPVQTKIVLWKRRLIQWLQEHTLVVGAPFIIIASIQLSTIPVVAEGFIFAYGLLAVIRRIPSRVSFWLATVVLAGIGIQFLLLRGTGQVNNSALFVFFLLCIGLVCLTRETRRMVIRDKASRRR